MRAAQEFLAKEKIANITGWVVSGASKRGWTTWMAGVTKCDTCVNVIGLIPIVPIVPDMWKDVHR